MAWSTSFRKRIWAPRFWFQFTLWYKGNINGEQVLTLWVWSSMNKKEKGRATFLLYLRQTPLWDHYSTQFSKQWMGGFLASVHLENISSAISLVPNSGFHCLGHSSTMPKKSLYCLPFRKTSRTISTTSFSPNNKALCNLRKVSELIFPQLLICYLNYLFDCIISSSLRDPV